MANPILKKLFGTQNDRTLKQVQPLVNRINELEPLAKKLSDDELKAKTSYFRERFAKGESVDALLPEVFSISREASFRILGMRAYDVQLVGGIVLHQGKIAEMKTGEGKTLTAVAPCFLNGLTGKGVHVVTVNDYLAKRDSEWMGGIHRFMGLSVGNIIHGMTDQERKASYGSDITYGQNNEFGFDYLRDNMKFRIEDYVQREHHFAIVDEVDSILIDEARTPLIISGPAELSTEIYYQINSIMPLIIKDPENYAIEEKTKSATLTDEGIETAQRILKIENLFDPVNIETLHSLNQALRAHTLYKTDVDYVVNNGEVIIVDEFTGRMMPGRRWSDGLHQAIEAKEGVRIENENQTLASITFQNYFRMYDKLSGMTGTADTEATEFKKIYNLDVVVIPTNRPLARTDRSDVVYKNIPGKFRAITKEIKESHEIGQPVLVGTVSIEKSELLSAHLKEEKIPHNVLNAKQHEKEATFVAQAGRKGAVTIATNMAGRGTDIVLGGNAEFMAREEATRQGINPTEQFEQYGALLKKFEDQCESEKREVIQAGGLHIIGTERHESRRIDNQLRGRSGRQGDPGSSRFYLCLEDDLMRIFGAERIQKFMNTFGMEEDEPIEHKLVTKAIENAQKKVEGHNYDIRKHLLEYDDVMNQQRKVIYELRRRVLEGKHLRELIFEMIEELVDEMTGLFWIQRKPVSEWNFKGINEAIRTHFAVDSHLTPNDLKGNRFENLYDVILEKARIAYEAKEAQVGETIMRDLEKMVFLQTIDHLWKDHLLQMDHLKEGIGLRGYAQKDPLLEYKKEGFELFERMKFQIKFATISRIMEVQLLTEEEVDEQRRQFEQMEEKFADQIELQRGPVMSHNKELGRSKLDQLKERQEREAEAKLRTAREAGGDDSLSKTVKRDQDKVGRNDPCPCGSGKKYKKCHGQ